MAFKTGKGEAASLESPETLFNDLRSKKVKGLLAHQADMLREYVTSASSAADVALQMPTGSGKTLVGLLIAEWRRRKNGESVVFLCPTNQLVHQVADQAISRYGLRVLPFTGSKGGYDASAKGEYLAAETVAVTSYSSLFNVRPFFESPRVIILDDAHSAENYIASAWSARIERLNIEHKSAFDALVGLLSPHLQQAEVRRLRGDVTDRWDITWVEKVPTPVFQQLAPELASILDTYTADNDLRYPWSWLRNHLHACHLYLSAYEILIRPITPPTFTHAPFSGATQRIYMSATLGEGGDLERITGRRAIQRLKGPVGWDQQTIGRRFFIFPERSIDRVTAQEVYVTLMKDAGRSLFLVPDDRSAQSVREWLNKTVKFKLFSAKDIEQSKHAFIEEDSAVAVVANRYDGIDLAEDECRLLFVEGIPGAVNVQERFLITRMGAGRVLDDRILTRTVQAFGRCTRSTTDYAAVVICGDELNRYLLKPDSRHFFHPELQAELQFGIDQSKDATADNFVENFRLFLEQTASWRAADNEIVRLRSSFARKPLAGSDSLRKAVWSEIAYAEAIWAGNYDLALDHAKSVLGQIAGDELKGYRAFWYYLAGSAAHLAAQAGASGMQATAKELFNHARKTTSGVRWLYALSTLETGALERPADDPRTLTLVERIEERFADIGTLNNRKFDQIDRDIRDGLLSDDSSVFERSQERLGWLLGYESGRNTDQGAPDPWWQADDDFSLVFEDYTEATPDSVVSVTKARQVASHPNWMKANVGVSPTGMILPVLVTSATKVAKEALPHLRSVYLWPTASFRVWAVTAIDTIRAIRRNFPGHGDLAWRADAATALDSASIGPVRLAILIKTRPAADCLEPIG
ncbi:MAG: DEAD/DEAH box helicase [Gemmatimonadaceae bacterium]